MRLSTGKTLKRLSFAKLFQKLAGVEGAAPLIDRRSVQSQVTAEILITSKVPLFVTFSPPKGVGDGAEQLLREFKAFYTGDIGIRIEPKEHDLCWSITATLTVNGEEVKTEDPCDLLFLELNELMLKRMIQLGIPSRQETAK